MTDRENAEVVVKLRLKRSTWEALQAEAAADERTTISLVRKILVRHVERQSMPEPQSIRAELEGAIEPTRYSP